MSFHLVQFYLCLLKKKCILISGVLTSVCNQSLFQRWWDEGSLCKRTSVLYSRAYRPAALSCGCGGRNTSLSHEEALTYKCGAKLSVEEACETDGDAVQMF